MEQNINNRMIWKQFQNKRLYNLKSLCVLPTHQATDAPEFMIGRAASGLRWSCLSAYCLRSLKYIVEPLCHSVPISQNSVNNGCHLKDAGGYHDGA